MNAALALPGPSPLELLAERSPESRFWLDAAKRARRFSALMGAAQPPPTRLTERDRQRLRQALRSRAKQYRVSHEQAASEIESLSRELPPFEQGVLFQELLRGLDPVRAFDTYRLDHLFTESELAAIEELQQRTAGTRVRLPMVRWAPGKDIEYKGYVCALVKVTRQCNLRCGYCHDWRSGPESRMKFDVLLQLVAKLLSSENHASIDFVWHGGEPTLVGKREFLRTLALQSLFQRADQEIRNAVQTNATSINESWAIFLSDFGFKASVSLDGPREIHDRARPMASGRSSYDAVRKGLALLQRYGLAGGVLMVLGDEIVEYGAARLVEFLQTEGLTKVALLPVRPDNPPTLNAKPYLPQRTFAQFLIDVHRARLARPKPWVAIRELDALLKSRRGEMPSMCEHLGNCVGNFFSVEANGDVGHCDKYLGDSEYKLGNILRDDFDAIRASDKVQALQRQADQSRERMTTCRHYARCRGWCPHERYVAKRTQLGVDPKCCGLGPIFDALDELEARPA